MFKTILALLVLFPSVSSASPKFTTGAILMAHARCTAQLSSKIGGTKVFRTRVCACLVDQKRVQMFLGNLSKKVIFSCVHWAQAPRGQSPVFLAHKKRLGLSTYTLTGSLKSCVMAAPKGIRLRHRVSICMCYMDKLLNSGKHTIPKAVRKLGPKAMVECIRRELFPKYRHKHTA